MTQRPIGRDAAAARLADIERELAQLQYRHDIAMSAFLFEEATALGRAIAALERERQAVAADLPPLRRRRRPTLARPPRRTPRRR